MSGWIVCHEKKADTPYLLKTIGKNIYTIEELCFYFWQYAHLLEDVVMDKKMTAWIRDELRIPKLADELEKQLKDGVQKEEMIEAVFGNIQYLSEQEWALYVQNLKKLQNLSPFEKSKKKADDFVKNKQYYKALYEYNQLLKEDEAQDEETVSRIYHNMGVASCKMFFFRQGSEYFLKAFLAVPNKESLRQYKIAVRLCEEEIQEDTLVKEFPSSASMDVQIYQEIQAIEEKKQGKLNEVEELKQLKNAGKIAEYYDKMEEMMQKWQDECRQYMNNR